MINLKELTAKFENKLLKEGVNKRLSWMDELTDQLGSEKKVLEEVFRALSDKEAKEIHAWIMRHWS